MTTNKTIEDAIPKVDGQPDVIGGRHGRIGGHQQVTGASQYADDINYPGMLHGKILRSPHAHAKILKLTPRKL